MRLSFVVLGLGLLSTLVECEKNHMLILNDVSKTPNTGYYFRSNILYLPAGYQSVVTINCTLPDWYNATQPNTYKYEWTDPAGTVLLADRGSMDIRTNSPNGIYKCVVKDSKDSKPLAGWDITEMKVFRQTAQTRNSKKPAVYISVWNDDDGNHINYTSVDPHPVDHELILTCVCDGCSAPEPYYWLLDGKNVSDDGKRGIFHNGTSLNIAHPFYKDVGIYTCISEANKDALAFTSITGVPIFAAKGGKGSDNKLEGETVTVTNELYGNPINRFQWKRSEDDDNFDNAEVVNVYDAVDKKKEKLSDEFLSKNGGLLKRLKFYPTLDAPNGELEITELEKEDRATYIAEATGYGGQNASFANLVRVKGKLDALWPFLGIVAEVILLVAIIFIYERRRAKKEAELEENPEQKQPLKTNDNLRQRKA